MPAAAALLLLADGRFPVGGHAHSGGVEAAVVDGRVFDVASLAAFTDGRLRTVGLVEVAFAMATAVRLAPPGGGRALAASAGGPMEGTDITTGSGRTAPLLPPTDPDACALLLASLDTELDARIPVPALRAASRRLGRQLLRVGTRCWPSPLLDAAMAGPQDTHQPIAFGLVGVASGMSLADVGDLVAHHALTTPMQAGVRLLGLDPFAVAAATAGLAETARAVVREAASFACGPLAGLPARSATRIDLAAVGHASADSRLFAT